ncbi:unnamed protein product, partial [Mesorhabditis belari]|uniref:Uncharacterized protein n=1 Tax=Mesorhabditis belari TaxID=2138241 RepID=A0AAF3E9P4_9BILA
MILTDRARMLHHFGFGDDRFSAENCDERILRINNGQQLLNINCFDAMKGILEIIHETISDFLKFFVALIVRLFDEIISRKGVFLEKDIF